MRRYAQLILLLPLLSFAAYVAYFYLSTGSVPWIPFEVPKVAISTTAGLLEAESPPRSSVPTGWASGTAPSSQAIVFTSTPSLPIPRTPGTTPTLDSLPGLPAAATASAPTVDAEIADGISRAAPIIVALEAYYRDHGAYPSDLSMLVPDHLAVLPLTATDQPFHYRTFASEHALATELYWLSFRVAQRRNLSCTYLRRIEYWDCNPASL
jgi:hypothetical protein